MSALGLSPLELVAALLGAVSVWLGARQHLGAWPTTILAALLSAVVYWQTRLYAQVGLQAVYVVLGVSGWWQWRFGGEAHGALRVRRTPVRLVPALVGATVAGTVLLALGLARFTDAALPWPDAALTAASLVAQWMLTRKLYENWMLWIVLDLAYLPVLAGQRLWAFVGLYAVLLVLAVQGHRAWRRDLRTRELA